MYEKAAGAEGEALTDPIRLDCFRCSAKTKLGSSQCRPASTPGLPCVRSTLKTLWLLMYLYSTRYKYDSAHDRTRQTDGQLTSDFWLMLLGRLVYKEPELLQLFHGDDGPPNVPVRRL